MGKQKSKHTKKVKRRADELLVTLEQDYESANKQVERLSGKIEQSEGRIVQDIMRFNCTTKKAKESLDVELEEAMRIVNKVKKYADATMNELEKKRRIAALQSEDLKQSVDKGKAIIAGCWTVSIIFAFVFGLLGSGSML